MNYEYRAQNAIGATQHGTIEAVDRDDATLRLEREGLTVIEIDSVRDALSFVPNRIRKSDVIYVANQLSIMVETGISLSAALQGICDQTDNPTLQTVLSEIRSRIEAGDDFSSALARYPQYFDKTFVSLIRASERTGTLGPMLERVASYLRGQLDTQQRVRAAMAYPAIMLVLAISTTIFLLAYILPKFTPLFKTKGIKLPRPTLVMMGLSDALTNYWPFWTIAALTLIAVYYFGRSTLIGRKIIDGGLIHLPLIGRTYRKVIISRCISTLGAMIQSGVSMLECMELCAEISNNYYFEQAWKHVREQITEGNRIAESLRNNRLFPRTLIQMINAGEETGKLDIVLGKVSVYYDREVETALKATTSLIEPIMITMMGVIVGAIGLGIMLPIFALSRGGR